MGDVSKIAERMVTGAGNLRTIVEPLKGQMDRERKLPQQIVDLMREEQLLSLWLPVEYGGPDLSMLDSVKVIEALAQVDGAIGWCACTAAINNRLAGFLPPTSANQIFDAGRTEVAPVSWTPAHLCSRSPRCRSQDEPTPLSSVANWSSWWTPAAHPRSWHAIARRSRSGTGWGKVNVTRDAAMAA